jgi:hypothetical protein
LYWVQHVLSLFPSTHAIRLSALLFCLLTGSVSAQPIEAVTVEDSSVAGVWKFTAPQGFSASLLGKTRWGPMTDEFCEIEKIRTAMTVHCPGLHFDGTDISREPSGSTTIISASPGDRCCIMLRSRGRSAPRGNLKGDILSKIWELRLRRRTR